MSDELKPCPFCGSKSMAYKTEGERYWTATCELAGCVSQIGLSTTKEEAIKAWNTRAEHTQEKPETCVYLSNINKKSLKRVHNEANSATEQQNDGVLDSVIEHLQKTYNSCNVEHHKDIEARLQFAINKLRAFQQSHVCIKREELEKMHKHCNHHHPLTEEHEIVDFGDGEFVANKQAIPLLKALNNLGLRTRTHHVDNDGGFFSVLLEENIIAEIKTVNEVNSTRTKYNGKTELLLSWHNLAKKGE